MVFCTDIRYDYSIPYKYQYDMVSNIDPTYTYYCYQHQDIVVLSLLSSGNISILLVI